FRKFPEVLRHGHELCSNHGLSVLRSPYRMWIVKIALQLPYTFLVLAILILLMGTLAALRTATDIFPAINIPVVATIWRYTGLQPEDMANRIVLGTERGAQTTVNDVEHTESQSLNGIAEVK